ncbi:DsbA family oxidoreductase [Dehalobacterium formicoaceticum]|uniref:DsbA family oxidoreductase n=1 Tax=Dehalobacterium formicoaceticum TaxID=51515 RepID=UPI000B7FCC50|nr:DsbA family protein [Dehalobacterium formicoaceticum]
MGKGILYKLQKKYPLEVQWVGYELHPETPKEGIWLRDQFPNADLDMMKRNLNLAGKPYDVVFNKMERSSNTKLALAATEFAREKGKLWEFQDVVYQAYFGLGEDIGQLDIVLASAQKIGLDVGQLEKALQEEKYTSILKESHALGEKYHVEGIPTFIFENGKRIFGAERYEIFVKVLKELSER